jgi:hypothetical protein
VIKNIKYIFTLAQTNNQMMDADHLTIINVSLQRLFENSKYLDDESFIAFSSALCRMSAEISGVPFTDNESMATNKSSRAVSYSTRKREKKMGKNTF